MARLLTLVMILMIGLLASVAFAGDGQMNNDSAVMNEGESQQVLNYDPDGDDYIDGHGGTHRNGGGEFVDDPDIDDFMGDGGAHGPTNHSGDCTGWEGLLIITPPLI